jgi:YhcH/YjgK/YiaL family protein
MIFGHICNTNELMKILPDSIQKAIIFLQEIDIDTKEVGEYEIQGKDIYAQIVDIATRHIEDSRPEVHRKYVDVQFLFKGSEKIRFAIDNGKNIVYEDMLEDKDLLLYENVEDESEITMTPGNFAIFYPQDIHRPTLINKQVENIRKVIVKVSVELV